MCDVDEVYKLPDDGVKKKPRKRGGKNQVPYMYRSVCYENESECSYIIKHFDFFLSEMEQLTVDCKISVKYSCYREDASTSLELKNQERITKMLLQILPLK